MLVAQLFQKSGAYGTRTDYAKSQRQCGQIKAAMHCSQRLHAVSLIYEYSDVVLTAALCDGPACPTGCVTLTVKEQGVQAAMKNA